MYSSLAGRMRATRRRAIQLGHRSQEPLIVRLTCAVRSLGHNRSVNEVSSEITTTCSSVQAWHDLCPCVDGACQDVCVRDTRLIWVDKALANGGSERVHGLWPF